MQMKKGWKIFWTVIISLTGAGVVFCIIALCLGVTFSQFEKAYPNGIGIIRKNYVSFEEDWDDDDDDEPEETENVVSGETFSNVENLKLDIGASEVQIKTGTDDKVHVDDLIEAMVRMMATGDDFTGPVNIGNPREFSMLELAQLVLKLTASKSKIVYQPLPYDDPRQRRPDITLAKEKLDWKPTVRLEEGLIEVINYFKQILSK
mgnify:CR=1 FL=1